MAGINTFEHELTEDERAQIFFQDGGQLVIDLNSIGEMKFELIPKGIYNALVDECNFGVSKDRGDGKERHPRFEFVIALQDPPYDKRKLYFYASFSPKALSGTKTALLRIAPDIFDQKFNPEEVANSGVLLGRPIKVKVDHEEYQGQTRAKISYLVDGDAPAGANAGQQGGGSFFS